HREKGRGRLGRHPVRRVRRRNSQLPADHEGLELHGAPLSPAARNPRWHLDISRGTACELRPTNVRSPPPARELPLCPAVALLIALPVICVMSMLAYLAKTGELHFRGNLSRTPRLRREHEKSRIRAAL